MVARTGRPKLTPQQRKYATNENAYKSGLEDKMAEQIAGAGHPVHYETVKLAYLVPARAATYRPDFVLPNGIVIESKGMFTTEDRQKMRLIRQQYPDLDIRMVFSNARARIAKKSKTTYEKWCETYGFPCAHRDIPKEWLTEAPKASRVRALQAAQALVEQPH